MKNVSVKAKVRGSFQCKHLFLQEMRRINKWIMNDDNHADSNCFALTIISHGNDKGHLFDKSRKKAWDTELFVADLSDVETLVGKPKIIVIQACRGCKYWMIYVNL